MLYVAAEGAHGLKQRLDAWETGWQNTIADTDAFDVLPQPVNLTRTAEVMELEALVATNGYGLVVIDTLARCMVGGDENSAQDCGLVVDVLHRLRRRTPDGRGVVLGVHHTGKDGKTFRGSSVFEAGADTVYSVTVDGAVITLDREKRKDGPRQDTHHLKLDAIPGTESCAVSVHRGVDKPERAERLLSTFVQHFVHTGASKAELRNVADMSAGTFHRALSDLLASGDLNNDGTDKRPFYKVAPK
ncbi:AAA family ATPase [Mycolicibacterium duvalii]|nr:AAA family ATPase [Mycolicibacterium duvalii]